MLYAKKRDIETTKEMYTRDMFSYMCEEKKGISIHESMYAYKDRRENKPKRTGLVRLLTGLVRSGTKHSVQHCS